MFFENWLNFKISSLTLKDRKMIPSCDIIIFLYFAFKIIKKI
jgi:hypothetical protein